MKKSIMLFAFAIGMLCNSTLVAQTPLVQEINLSADKVWEEIREMDNIDQLSSFVSQVKWTGPKNVGGQRVCTAADGSGYFKEKITHFDDAGRTYSYQVVEGVPAKNMQNVIKVVDLGYNKSMIVWTSNFEFVKNPNMTLEQFNNFLLTARKEMVSNIINSAQKA